MRDVQLENVNSLRLTLLVEVERRGSIAAAAEACAVGQPSASMHLRTLEAATGRRLLNRNGRGSVLTDSGRIVAAHAARVLSTLEVMQTDLQELNGGEQANLSIAASGAPSVALLPAALRQFRERYPGAAIKVETVPSELVVRRVARHEADLGVAGEIRSTDNVDRETILHDELVGVGAKDRVRLRDGAVAVEDLGRSTLLVAPPSSSTRAVAQRYLSRVGFLPQRLWQFDSDEAIKQAVLAGLGITFLSRLLIGDERDRDEVATFGVLGVEPMRRLIQVVRPSDRALTPAASTFAELLAHHRPTDPPNR